MKFLLKFCAVLATVAFITGCSFNSVEPYYSSSSNIVVKNALITRSVYEDGRYSYDIKGSLNSKTISLRVYSDRYFYDKGQRVEATINGNRAISMKLLSATNPQAIGASKERTSVNTSIDLPSSTQLSF